MAHHLDSFILVDTEWLRLINSLLRCSIGFKLQQWVLRHLGRGRLRVKQVLLSDQLLDATCLFLVLLEHVKLIGCEHMLHVLAMEAYDC